MSDSEHPTSKRRLHAADISRPRSWWYLKWQQWNNKPPLLGTWTAYLSYAMVLAYLAYFFTTSDRLGWFGLAMFGLLFSIVVICNRIAYFRLGWWRLAQLPAALVAKGQLESAELAFQKALKRASRFSPDDVRRASMLSYLALYLDGRGRLDEAKNLSEECIEIYAKHAKEQAADYLTALNNYAVSCINIKDYAGAQELLETVVDFMPGLKKQEATRQATFFYPREELELLYYENLAYLFVKTNKLAEAEFYLSAATPIFNSLHRDRQAFYRDYLFTLRAMWNFASGNHVEALSECNQAADQKYILCLEVRAKINIACQHYAQAEALLREYEKVAMKTGVLHHPAFLDHTLDLADALFGQAKHDDAFASLQEARSIVADFALPPDAAWKKTLETWLQRARDLGKTEVAASLDAELQKIPATANQAITILEKFRVHPPTGQ